MAIVASRDLEYGISRMYQVYVDGLPVEVKVFRNIEPARNWVGESD